MHRFILESIGEEVHDSQPRTARGPYPISTFTNSSAMAIRIFAVILIVSAAATAWAWCGPHRDKYETAAYKVLTKKGAIEIREYPALSLASAKMNEPAKQGANQGFRSLFGYISGQNEAAAKIAMTTPVFMDGDQMSFVLPEDVAQKGAPAPKGTEVALKKFPGGKFAVLRFPGTRSSATEAKAEAELRQVAKESGVTLQGSPLFAYYDPPFTLPPFRRNEVLIRTN
jgi:DNA gyrase inhibitor GyrI